MAHYKAAIIFFEGVDFILDIMAGYEVFEN